MRTVYLVTRGEYEGCENHCAFLNEDAANHHASELGYENGWSVQDVTLHELGDDDPKMETQYAAYWSIDKAGEVVQDARHETEEVWTCQVAPRQRTSAEVSIGLHPSQYARVSDPLIGWHQKPTKWIWRVSVTSLNEHLVRPALAAAQAQVREQIAASIKAAE